MKSLTTGMPKTTQYIERETWDGIGPVHSLAIVVRDRGNVCDSGGDSDGDTASGSNGDCDTVTAVLATAALPPRMPLPVSTAAGASTVRRIRLEPWLRRVRD